ncbi:MAG: helix-turn-helix domain-containing protein [Bacteroidaceae bacterium]|nr:helix-turn-helix domain-containing protein [Bacteroidaceae bacterium]
MFVCWILEGGLDLTVNLQPISVHQRQILVIMSGCVLQLKNSVDNTKLILMAIDANIVKGVLRKMGLYMSLADRYFHFFIRNIESDESLQRNLDIYRFIKRELSEPDYENKAEVIKRLFEVWIIKNMELGNAQDVPSMYKPPTRKEQIFRDFLSLLDQDFRRERSISYYADRMCLTPKYLSTTIREVSGKHGMQWIDEYVALEAKALLRNSDMSVKQVSDNLNFPSQSMFGRFFRKMTGYSPKQYKML